METIVTALAIPGLLFWVCLVVAVCILMAFLPSVLHRLFAMACSKGIPLLAKFLLFLGMSPDTRLPGSRTGLMHAAILGKVRLARVLLSAGADASLVDSRGMGALYYAVWADSPEMTEFLLRTCGYDATPSDGGLTPLMSAALNGQGKQVYLLLKYGAGKGISRYETGAALVLARRIRQEAIAHYLEYVLSEKTAADRSVELTTACLAGDAAQVKTLLTDSFPADVLTVHGFPLLVAAAQDGNVEMAKELIAAGVDATQTTAEGKSLLHYAVENRRREAARFFLQTIGYTGAAVAEGLPLLQVAAEDQDTDMVGLLLEFCPPDEPYKELLGQELLKWRNRRKVARVGSWFYGPVCAMFIYMLLGSNLEKTGIVPSGVASVLDVACETCLCLGCMGALLFMLFCGLSVVEWLILFALAVCCVCWAGFLGLAVVVCIIALIFCWGVMDDRCVFSFPWRSQKNPEPDDDPEKS